AGCGGVALRRVVRSAQPVTYIMPGGRMRTLVPLVTLIVLFLVPAPVSAIPVFARRYRVSCQLCHNPVPALTTYGETFASNGFRMSPNEAPRDTINTGDPELWLPSGLPLAIRLDAYAQAYS